MGSTDLQNWNSPDNTTSPKTLGARVLALANTIERQVVLHFASATARNTATPGPIPGCIAWLATPNVFTWFDGNTNQWRLLMNNVTQDLPGMFYGVTAAGQLGIRIGGINVRNVRYHNYGATRYMTATATGVANVGAAGTINVAIDLNVDGTANGAVQIRDVNYAIRERSFR